MDEKCLQVAFEIKLSCDALSRRILRWHWEKTPRPNTLRELMHYLAKRSLAAPDYYLNVGVSDDITSWQQLDTTLCMRVLLDSETGEAAPKHLLQYALKEGLARRACNGLRLARNAAAHATDKAGVIKSIALFDETLTDLEEAYGLTLFSEKELEEYDALVKKATAVCSANKSVGVAKKTSASNASKTTGRSAPTCTTSAAKAPRSKKGTSVPQKQAVRNGHPREIGFVCLALIVFLAAICAQLMR